MVLHTEAATQRCSAHSICNLMLQYRSSHPKVLLEKGVLKICSKFTGEHPCRRAISIKLQSEAHCVYTEEVNKLL